MAPAAESDDSEDDEDEMNALLADVTAEASNLSRWLESEVGVPGSSAVPVGAAAPGAAPTCGAPSRERSCLSDDAEGEPLVRAPKRSHDVSTPEADVVATRTVPALKAEAASLVDTLAGGLGPIRLMAWGAAFVV